MPGSGIVGDADWVDRIGCGVDWCADVGRMVAVVALLSAETLGLGSAESAALPSLEEQAVSAATRATPARAVRARRLDGNIGELLTRSEGQSGSVTSSSLVMAARKRILRALLRLRPAVSEPACPV
jgi:hypothetical protein